MEDASRSSQNLLICGGTSLALFAPDMILSGGNFLRKNSLAGPDAALRSTVTIPCLMTNIT